ncbi:aspartate kinase [Candidatus Bathyarchaeota archaeon ex4484_231]|nr:MAG: aspartate kinase [Candidatus Bathyarchaeota archaeon ex4484_231]
MMKMKKDKKPFGRLVAKFGGSSLADGTAISRAANSVIKKAEQGVQIAVVVSAMGKTTDHLIDTAKTACGEEIPNDELDDIIAMGERTNARIFSASLRAHGWESRYMDPVDPDWPIITDDVHLNAKPILPVCERLIKRHVQPLLEKGVIVVVPGFIGKTEHGKITTLGRGGSDITAMILAQALAADQVVLVTDVEGIMTADPKIIKKPLKIKEISMDALVGLADSGTKFIHKKALRYKNPEMDVKVISNSAGSLDAEGTIIRGSFPKSIFVDPYSGSAMAITIVGKAVSESMQTLAEILREINKAKAPLLGMSINHNSLVLYLPVKAGETLLELIHSIVVRHRSTLAMGVRKNLAFIRVKGIGLEETPGVISSITKALNSANINIYGTFTITSSVVVFVDLKNRKKAIQLIEEAVAINNNSELKSQLGGKT